MTVGRVKGFAEIEISSSLAAPCETMWQRMSQMAGVNAELMPVARHRAPPSSPTC
jgi:hypothetical protein